MPSTKPNLRTTKIRSSKQCTTEGANENKPAMKKSHSRKGSTVSVPVKSGTKSNIEEIIEENKEDSESLLTMSTFDDGDDVVVKKGGRHKDSNY